MNSRALAALATVVVCAAPSAAQAAQSGSYAGRLYSINDKALSQPVKGTAVTFKVSNRKVRSFTAKGGTSTCLIINPLPPFIPSVHVYPLAFTVPAAPVRNNALDTKYRIAGAGVTNWLRGNFRGRSVDGRIDQSGPTGCAAHYRWKAKLR